VLSTSPLPPHQAHKAHAPHVGLATTIQNNSRLNLTDKQEADKRLCLILKEAFEKLRAGCAACWARGRDDWSHHVFSQCQETPCNKADAFWQGWSRDAFKALSCCYVCGLPQVWFNLFPFLFQS
jgi:hypothetical protein